MAEDPHVKELVEKVGALVSRRFNGDYRQAFTHYARSHSAQPTVDAKELEALLGDAGVGNFITRGAWVSGIIDRVDKDADRKISWDEFESVIKPTR